MHPPLPPPRPPPPPPLTRPPPPPRQIKQQAVELVQGLTGSPEGIAQLASCTDALLPPLFRLVGSSGGAARPAAAALVNLSQEPSAQRKLLDLNAPARCMDYLKEGACPGQEDLLVMLLANLTAAEDGAAALLQLGRPGLEGLNLAILLKLFLEGDAAGGEGDPYEHVATILPNLTRFKAGRQVVLEPGRGTLRALTSQLRSGSELRRRGCAGAIKNCCLSCEEDATAEAVAGEAEALGDVLGVLSGVPTLETDDIVRENLAEAVLCLAKVPAARKQLWAVNAPELLRKAYEMEEHPGVCEAMEGAAQFFLEDGFQQDEEGGDADAAEAEAEAAAEPAEPAEPQHPDRPDVSIQEIE